jgi:hypothetical protein
MNRTLNVVRMQLVNRQTYIWVPLMVLAGSLIISLAVYAIIASSGVTVDMFGGGAQAPLWYFAVVGAQAMTLTFPFSQAMSVSRREFYLGTLLSAGLTAAILAIVFVIGGLIEQATDGWGMNGYIFYLPWVWEAGPAGAALVFFTLAMVFFIVGFWGATIFKRWGTLAVTIVIFGFALLLVVALWLVARSNAWAEVFGWLAEQGAVTLSLWGIVAAVVLGGASYLTLRRSVP